MVPLEVGLGPTGWPQQIQKCSRSDEPNTLMFADLKQIRVSGDHEYGTTLNRCGNVHIVVRVIAHACDSAFTRHELREHNDVLKPEFWLDFRSSQLTNLWVREGL